MKRLLKGALAILVLLVGAAVAVGYVEKSARDQAKAFCARFPAGSSFDAARRAAETEGDRRHRSVRDNELMVAHIGVPPFSRHLCVIKASDGKVASSEYRHLD